MVVFPNCKINLGLHILRKRADGYHDLETVFYPLRLCDALEIVPASLVLPVTFTASGLTITGKTGDNLCVKAYHLLKKDFPLLPSVQLHLHKVIPMGAGLGGGSADGAFTLQLLNSVFQLGLSSRQLAGYALQLGSDCPFFMLNQPCIASSRGEILHPTDLDLSSYAFVLVNPLIHVSTAMAFSQIRPHLPSKPVSRVIRQPVATWKKELVNDFEAPVASQFPEISLIKEQLYQKGALYAAMSGSGSTVFGMFEKHRPPVLDFPSHYFVQIV